MVILTDPESRLHQPVLIPRQRCNHTLRDDRWCCIRYEDGSEEFYHDLNDPDQHTTRAGHQDNQIARATLDDQLPAYESVLMTPE